MLSQRTQSPASANIPHVSCLTLANIPSRSLQGTNVSHLGKRKIIFKSAFGWDMLVPWRVFTWREPTSYWSPLRCSNRPRRWQIAHHVERTFSVKELWPAAPRRMVTRAANKCNCFSAIQNGTLLLAHMFVKSSHAEASYLLATSGTVL